jgi:hypothetical protein
VGTITKCRQQGHGHLIPSGTESMRLAGARKIACEVWFIKDHSFAVYSDEGLITLEHHQPERLIGALMSTNVIMVELAPKLEVIRVHLDQPGIPLRFYMTSGELKPCH